MTSPADLDDEQLAAAFRTLATAYAKTPPDTDARAVRLRVIDAVLDERVLRRG